MWREPTLERQISVKRRFVEQNYNMINMNNVINVLIEFDLTPRASFATLAHVSIVLVTVHIFLVHCL